MGATQKLLRFGLFELNLDTEELRKDGIPIKLPPQPFRILALLANRAGQIVPREEIRQQIWGGETYVDFEHGMNQCIKQIRTALNDNADTPVYVETLPRRGYRFLASVVVKTVAEPAPRVVESKSGIQSVIANLATVREKPAPTADPYLAPRGIALVPSTGAAPALAVLPAAEADAVPSVPALEIEPARKPTPKKRFVLGVLGVIALVALIGVALYWQAHKPKRLTEKDTIVLADFVNTTGDAVFDDALNTALSIELKQSPFLHVLSQQKVRATLKLMNYSEDERLTPEVTREICRHTKSTTMLTSSISDDGNKYQIQLQALNCQTGNILATVNAEAENRNLIVRTLGVAGNQLRGKLGESPASLRDFDRPLDEATSSSPEALQSFTRALRAQRTGGDILPYLRRAVELDPGFASAYMALGVVYRNLGETGLSNQNMKKAYEFRQRFTQHGQLDFETHYYTDVTGELDKAIQTYEELEKRYPDTASYRSNRAEIHSLLGQYEKAVAEEREGIRLMPDNSFAYSNLMYYYNSLDRVDDSMAAFEEARARKLDGRELRINRYSLAFLQDDKTAMQEQLTWATGKPRVEDRLLSMQSDTEAYHGHFRAARELSRRAAESATHAGAPELAAAAKAMAALREAEVGNTSHARQMAAEALGLSAGRNVQVIAALALARAGDVAQAQELAIKLDRDFPVDTLMQNYYLPSIRAAIALDSGKPVAIDLLNAAIPYELGASPAFAYLYPAYLRGQAYLKAGQPQQSAKEFQKLIGHPGTVGNFVLGSMAHLQLGRAQAMMGDKPAARKSYQDFLALWKDADPDIPILKAAKSEYQHLN